MKNRIGQLEDPRRTGRGHILHKLEDISLYFDSFTREIPTLTTREKEHGRIERRGYQLLSELSWLPEQKDWIGLKAAGAVVVAAFVVNIPLYFLAQAYVQKLGGILGGGVSLSAVRCRPRR